jgi:hypothetical protein
LYNFGAMWINYINYKFYNPETVPNGDWAFFFIYLLGDFSFRFLYNKTNSSNA